MAEAKNWRDYRSRGKPQTQFFSGPGKGEAEFTPRLRVDLSQLLMGQ
jgi:hypothetical protein